MNMTTEQRVLEVTRQDAIFHATLKRELEKQSGAWINRVIDEILQHRVPEDKLEEVIQLLKKRDEKFTRHLEIADENFRALLLQRLQAMAASNFTSLDGLVLITWRDTTRSALLTTYATKKAQDLAASLEAA